jgi:hypothetical protein
MRTMILLLALALLASASLGQTTWSAEECYRRLAASPEYLAMKAKLPPIEPGTSPSIAQQTEPARAMPG